MSFAISFIASLYAFSHNSFAPVTLTPPLNCAPAEDGWLRVGMGFGQGNSTPPARFQFRCNFASDWTPSHCITVINPDGPGHDHQLEVSRNGYLGVYAPSERKQLWKVLQDPYAPSASQLLQNKYGAHPDPLRRLDQAEESTLAAHLLRISLSASPGYRVNLHQQSAYLCSERYHDDNGQVLAPDEPVALFLHIETLN
ncbi:hypothetical protein DCO48_08090 [Pseudomonas sp. SDI]|uniref:hypothetical protein n=1 Tax=Pseudomonas sp. SDI TaxID=2170734 RepID=UPI000DE60C1B|nr:hypothetical protein [Pseudomonas sp. SDI]PWB33929.1 hypothetical protein DCO48_08090 [Pseudomonas sp. SDI]